MGKRKRKTRTIKSDTGTKKLRAYDNEKRVMKNLEQKTKSERFLDLQERFEELDETELNELMELRTVHERYTKRKADEKARQRKYCDRIREQNKRFLELRDRFDKLNKKELKEYKECERAYEYTKKRAADRKRHQTENRDKCREYRHKSIAKQREKFRRRLELQERFDELNENELAELEECEEFYQRYQERTVRHYPSNKIFKLRDYVKECDKIRYQETIATQIQILQDHVKQIFSLEERIDELSDSELKELEELKSLGDINDLGFKKFGIVDKKAKQKSIEAKRQQDIQKAATRREEERKIKQRMQELQNRFGSLNEDEIQELDKCLEIDQKNRELNRRCRLRVKYYKEQKENGITDRQSARKRFDELQSRINELNEDEVIELEQINEAFEFPIKTNNRKRISSAECHRKSVQKFQQQMKRMQELQERLDELNEDELQELEECKKAYEQHGKEKLRKNERARLVIQSRKIMVEKIFLRKQKLRLAELESQVNNLNLYELSELENLIKDENKQQIKVRPELDEMREDLKQKSFELLKLIEEKRRRIKIEGKEMEEEFDESLLEEINAELLFQEESETDDSNEEELKLLKENIEKRGRRTTRKLEAVKKSKLVQDSESEREMEIVKESNKERTSRLRKNTRNSKENVRKVKEGESKTSKDVKQEQEIEINASIEENDPLVEKDEKPITPTRKTSKKPRINTNGRNRDRDEAQYLELKRARSKIKELEDNYDSLNEYKLMELESLKLLVSLEENDRRNQIRRKRNAQLTQEELKKLEELKEELNGKTDNELENAESDVLEKLNLLKDLEKRKKRQDYLKEEYMKRRQKVAELEAQIQEVPKDDPEKLKVLKIDFLKHSKPMDRTRYAKKRKAELESRLLELNDYELEEFHECERWIEEVYNRYKRKYEKSKLVREKKVERIAELEERADELTEQELNELKLLKDENDRHWANKRKHYRKSDKAKKLELESKRKAEEKCDDELFEEITVRMTPQIKNRKNEIKNRFRLVQRLNEESVKKDHYTDKRYCEVMKNIRTEQETFEGCKEIIKKQKVENENEDIEIFGRRKELEEVKVISKETLKDIGTSKVLSPKVHSSNPQTIASSNKQNRLSTAEEPTIEETIEIPESLLENVRKQLVASKSENLCALKCLIRELENDDFSGDGINVLYQIQIHSNNPYEELYGSIRIPHTLLQNIRENLSGTKVENLCALDILMSELEKLDEDNDCEMLDDLIVEETEKDVKDEDFIEVDEDEFPQYDNYETTECDNTVGEDSNDELFILDSS